MSVIKSICETANGLYSLLVGLSITGKNFASSQLTVHYPRQEVTNLSTYRGHVEFAPMDDNPFMPRCVGCGICAKSCPSNCITVSGKDLPAEEPAEGAEPGAKPKGKKKTVATALLNYSTCSLCGQCVRACPSGALRFSTNVYFAASSRDDIIIDLVERLRKQAEASKGATGVKAGT